MITFECVACHQEFFVDESDDAFIGEFELDKFKNANGHYQTVCSDCESNFE